MVSPSSSKILTAVWDAGRTRLTPGRALLLLQEIHLCRLRDGYDRTRIVWAGPSPVPQVLSYASCVDEIVLSGPADDLSGQILLEDLRGGRPGAPEESMLFIQDLCAGTPVPALTPRADLVREAREYLSAYRRRSGFRHVLTLHLKQGGGEIHGNADGREWAAFLTRARRSAPSTGFVAVGTELPREIAESGVAEWTRGASILSDLALIAGSDAFMGTASSLCQAALFGDKPYAVFKHPLHHAEAMRAQLTGPRGFTFAHPTQRFTMAPDQRDRLWEEFLRIQEVLG